MTTAQTQKYTYTLTGNGIQVIPVAGGFYKLIAATGLVAVQRDSNGSKISGLQVNQGEIANFQRLTVTDESGGTNTITILIGDGRNTFIDTNVQVSVNKSVQISGAGPTLRYTPASGAASNALLANANRQWMFVQNNDPAVAVWIRMGPSGSAAVGNGIKLMPGDVFEMNTIVHTGLVTVIGEAAGTANSVCFFEG